MRQPRPTTNQAVVYVLYDPRHTISAGRPGRASARGHAVLYDPGMRGAALIVVLAGCGFQTNAPDTTKPGPPIDAATAVDAATPGNDASMPMTDAAVSKFCDDTDQDLIACF